jgi:hypothetical protein
VRIASTAALCLLLLAGCGVASSSPTGGFSVPADEDATPLLRTDGSQPERWDALLRAIRVPNALGFLAFVRPITDPALEGLTVEQLRELPRAAGAETFVLVADAKALASDDFPILVVDVSGDNLPSFRVTAKCLWVVENNLSLANVDWRELLDATADDGVLRDC